MGFDLYTSANSVSATDGHSDEKTCREIGGKCMGLDRSCSGETGLQISEQSLIAQKQKLHRAEHQGAKTTTSKLMTHDNGNLVKFNQGNGDISEELHQLPEAKQIFQPFNVRIAQIQQKIH